MREVRIETRVDHPDHFYLVDGDCVASVNWMVGDWAAYSLPGWTGGWEHVADRGDKMDKQEAQKLFHWIADKYRWRP